MIMEKHLQFNSEKFNKFFSSPFDFSKQISLEKYLITSLGHDFVTEEERCKVLLKTSFTKNEAMGYASYSGGHPSRKFITKLMQIMRSLDTEIILFWMNCLQSDEYHRAFLQKCWRASGCKLSENWQTRAFRIWDFVKVNKFVATNAVIILPDKKSCEDHKDLDGAMNNFGMSGSNFFVRKNRYSLPSFCMCLNIDVLNECIIDMKDGI
jgi:hypothetical protein